MRQTQDFGRHGLLVDEHQVVGTVVSLEGFARLLDDVFRNAVGILDAQIHPKVFGRGLHELRITDPERFLSGSRIQEQH
ncbi:hypothetical protein D3C86_2014710 [compost metagenome]